MGLTGGLEKSKKYVNKYSTYFTYWNKFNARIW